MNILLVTPLYSQHYDAGWFWFRALQRLGHSVTVWDYRLDVQPPPFTVFPELTLVLKGEGLNPQMFPSPRFCYWPDAFERTPSIMSTLERYDRVFSPVRPTPSEAEWLPTGWDPAIHRDLKLPVKTIDSLYIGTFNSERKAEFIRQVKPQVVAGNEWEKLPDACSVLNITYPPAYLHDMVSLANKAKVLIDIHQGPVGLNRKFFEMIACGFTIVDRVPGVEEVLGKELEGAVSFKDGKQAHEMIKYYLGHPEEREALWKVEREAIQPYTYEMAVGVILQRVKNPYQRSSPYRFHSQEQSAP